jgi:glycosyltransferase involved in cell wall biosynthesis
VISEPIDVVLPCLDEAAALPWVLSRLPAGYRAIVVDNGSRDRSADLAREWGALVVDEPRRGFGAACHAGLLASTSDVVCFMDADASLDPGQLPLVTASVRAGTADLVLGRRLAATRSAWPVHARLANRLLARRISARTGISLHDLGPMRAASRKALLALELTDRACGYPLEMVLRAAGSGWHISEVDVQYWPRIGRSKVTGTITGTMRAVRDMRAVFAA